MPGFDMYVAEWRHPSPPPVPPPLPPVSPPPAPCSPPYSPPPTPPPPPTWPPPLPSPPPLQPPSMPPASIYARLLAQHQLCHDVRSHTIGVASVAQCLGITFAAGVECFAMLRDACYVCASCSYHTTTGFTMYGVGGRYSPLLPPPPSLPPPPWPSPLSPTPYGHA